MPSATTIKRRGSRLWRSLLFGGLTRLPESSWQTRSGRSALRAAQRALAGGEVTIAAGAAGGLRLDTDHLFIDHPHAYGLLRGVVEPSVQEALRRTVAPGATVYDIGADVGFFSILAARLTGPAGRVEAFEPVPESAAAVAANARLNGLSQVNVHKAAVGEAASRQTLHIRDVDSWSHLSDRGSPGVIRERMTVAVLCLDEEIAAGRLPVPDVIKLDVEGSEGAVLRGLAKTLVRDRPSIVCELHETNHEIAELLGRVGYSLENLDGTQSIEAAGPVHILARP